MKSWLIAWIAYWTGLDELFYWLNRKKKRILTFHNVLPQSLWRPGVANGVSCTVESFLRILEMCQARFGITNDLFAPGTLTLTFDDGYRNQYEYVYKLLRSKNLPAYFFVSGCLLNGGSALTVDKLTHWVQEVPLDCVPNRNRQIFWEKNIWPDFLKDSERRGEGVFERLDKIYPYEKVVANLPSEYVAQRLKGIAAEEFEEMRRDPNCMIGWHTKSHYPLSRLDDACLCDEMTPPKEMRNICFSYPYGEPTCVNSKVVGMAKKLGYPCAVSCIGNTRPTNLYFMPRSIIAADRYLFHFEMSGFKAFLVQMLKWARNH